jgi:acetyl esterase/lipase
MKYAVTVMLLATLAAPATQAAVADQDDALRLEPKWRALDRNADGAVSLDELHPIQARAMAAHDADANGEISLPEYVSFDLDPGNAAATPIPENVTLVQDLPYAGTSDPRQQLDIMLPVGRGDDEALPVIAYIHGGGWAVGSKISARTQMLPLVATGRYAAVSIGYRLSWQDTWPAQVHDVKAALRWIRANAGRYGLDADRICAFGPSAGGHLVAMLGTTNGESAVEGELGEHREMSSDVQCVVDFFGPTDLRGAEALNRLGQPSMVTQLLGAPAAERPELAAQASPVTHVDAGDVPFLIVHGTLDPLVNYSESVALDAALRQAGVRVFFQTIDGGGHGDFAANLPMVNERVDAFLRKQFYDPAVPVPADTLMFNGGAAD